MSADPSHFRREMARPGSAAALSVGRSIGGSLPQRSAPAPRCAILAAALPRRTFGHSAATWDTVQIRRARPRGGPFEEPARQFRPRGGAGTAATLTGPSTGSDVAHPHAKTEGERRWLERLWLLCC